MKVVLAAKSVYPFHSFGGVEKIVYYLAKYLLGQGIEVEVVTSGCKGGMNQTEHEGVPYTFLSPRIDSILQHRIGWFGQHIFSYRLAQYLDRNSFDLLHGFELAPLYYLRRKERKSVLLHLFVDNYRIRSFQKNSRNPVIQWVKLNPIKYCINSAEAIASEGPFQTQEMIQLYQLDSTKVFDASIGVDIQGIKKKLDQKMIPRGELGLEENDFVLISVNRLVPEKGVVCLLNAMALLSAENPKIKLILIGTGYEEESLFQKIRDLKLVHQIIHRRSVSENELYQYYKVSDLYVSPTLQDDFIMGIQEAMACGLPVVSTGQRWLVHEGENGYVVPKQDPANLAKAILKIYSQADRSTMKMRSEAIIQNYDWNLLAERVIKKYEDLLA